ncbi:MAG: hypothetical protein ACK4HV_04710, partial [Parachlamydiaceae bacterium]
HTPPPLFESFRPCLDRLTALFKIIVDTFTACFRTRAFKPIEKLADTSKKGDNAFKETVLDLKSFQESRFPKALWDLASGAKVNNLSFLEEVEKSLSELERKELKALIEKKNPPEFISFLRKLDRFEDRLEYLKSLLNDIQTGRKSREDLKLKVRELRKYFINRSTYFTENSGLDKGGHLEPLVKEFREPLFGPHPTFGSIYKLQDGFIINEAYKNRGQEKVLSWVAGFTMQEEGHAVAYLLSKKGFYKFDNLHAENRLYTIEEVSELLVSREGDVLTMLNFPLDKNKDRIPDLKSWVTPTWENNNCFAAASLVFLAACQHYAK